MWALKEWEDYCFCEEFKCLPYEGGLYQQPALKVECLMIVRNSINEYKTRKNEKLESDLRAKELIKGG
jgi:hypothetical protein